MDRRRSPRVQVQLPVHVWGMDACGQPFTGPALVTNMSVGGLVLQGLRRKIRAGEVLDVRMGEEIAKFQVVWVDAGSNELGMQRLTAEAFVPDAVLSHCSQAAAC